MRNLVFKAANKLLDRNDVVSFGEMHLTDEEAAQRRSLCPGPIEEIFFANTGRLAHKWVHYLPIYDRVFAPFRDTAPTMLEIGVSEGGSLEMWRKYFGSDATICGIDIEPAYAGNCDPPNQIRIGSQADPEFLRRVVNDIGAPDIVLDDGSHVSSHQRASFETLWPLLKVGGLYLIEDVQTAYWPHFEGGYRRPGTAIELAKDLIDDLHGWYHGRDAKLAARDEIGAVHVYDSIIVVEKVQRLRPGHYTTGG